LKGDRTPARIVAGSGRFGGQTTRGGFYMKSRKLLAVVFALPVFGIGAVAGAADSTKDYPNRPVRLMVPNAPGSSVDTLSRVVATSLSDVLGQQVVLDNRAGAAGVIAMEIAKDATPDGYTLISATTAASTIARLLQKKPTFHPVTDYDYVVQFAETPNVLVVNPNVGEGADRVRQRQAQRFPHGFGG
jgi:tripartite-type tricarboxylate transporter receptor subunit TctC